MWDRVENKLPNSSYIRDSRRPSKTHTQRIYAHTGTHQQGAAQQKESTRGRPAAATGAVSIYLVLVIRVMQFPLLFSLLASYTPL